MEYINFDTFEPITSELEDRIKYYYFFQEYIGKNKGKFVALLYKIQNLLIYIQKKIKLNRIENINVKFYKGSNWFDISHECALWILNNYKIYLFYFKKGLCVDELFIQTIIMLSPFKKNISQNKVRYIDWKKCVCVGITIYIYNK